MKQTSSNTTINDLLYAAVVFGAFAATAYGLSDALFDFRGHVAAAIAYAATVGTVTFAAVLAQPSVSAVRAALMRRRSELGTTSI